MKYTALALSTLVMFAGVACGGHRGADLNPFNAGKELAKDSELKGRFTADCKKTAPGLSLFQNTPAYTQSYDFVGSTVIRSTTYYFKGDCSGDSAYVIDETGSFDSKKSDDNKNNVEKGANAGYPIDLNFQSVNVKIKTPAGAEAANKDGLCGSKDWANDQSREVTGDNVTKSCLAAKPSLERSLYRIDAGQLFLADLPTRPNDKTLVDKGLEKAGAYDATGYPKTVNRSVAYSKK